MATVDTTQHAAGRNGQTDGAAGIAVENPATGQVIGHVEDMDATQVEALVDRARAAQAAWDQLGFAGRGDLMRALRYWMISERERVMEAVISENGKTREDALLAELFYLADSLGFWAKKAKKFLGEQRVRTHSPVLLGKKVLNRYRPLGVVGVIAPWNYPISLGLGDTIPALMAGNTVVIKPSEVTPLATKLVVEEGMKAAGFPEDVCLVASGAGETGAALVDHVDMIMFTGSTRTGKKVAMRAAERLIPSSLELGGKDPFIVLRDADLERAANFAVQWAFSNSGQICMSVERVYVEEPIYDEFVEKVVEKTKQLRQGVPGGAGEVEVGAMTFPPQIEKVESHVNEAVAQGAKVLVGGKRKEGPGRFFEPTVLVDVNHDMACMRDETFGPTMPIMKVRDADQAVELANDTDYGLNSAVFSKDVRKGTEVARRLSAGNTCVNDALMNYMAQEAPFAGAKESGLGARHSAAGIRKYCQPHTILVTRFGPKKEPTGWPNSAKTTQRFEKLMVLMWGRKPRRRARR